MIIHGNVHWTSLVITFDNHQAWLNNKHFEYNAQSGILHNDQIDVYRVKVINFLKTTGISDFYVEGSDGILGINCFDFLRQGNAT